MKFLSIILLVMVIGFAHAKETTMDQKIGLGTDAGIKVLKDNQLSKEQLGFTNESIQSVADMIGMSKNAMSDELKEQLNLARWGHGGHGQFTTYQACMNFDPECACVHEGLYWSCYFE